jgi:hypothetical protein
VKSAVGPSSDSLGDLVDRGATRPEIGDHLHCHLRREGRHALRRHAVIAGEDEHIDLIEARHLPPLPSREPGDHLLQQAQAAGWLGQPHLALRHGMRGRFIGARQVAQKLREEIGLASHHADGVSAAMRWKKLPVTRPRRLPANPRPVPCASASWTKGASAPGRETVA